MPLSTTPVVGRRRAAAAPAGAAQLPRRRIRRTARRAIASCRAACASSAARDRAPRHLDAARRRQQGHLGGERRAGEHASAAAARRRARSSCRAAAAICRAASPTTCSGSGRYAERADAIARLARTAVRAPRPTATERATRARPAAGGAARADARCAAGRRSRRPMRSSALDRARAARRAHLRRPTRRARCAGDRCATCTAWARVVRDRISSDTWRVLTSLDQELRDGRRDLGGRRQHDWARWRRCSIASIARLAALGGVVMESMTRGQAWRFLDMGRRLERALNLVLTLRATLTSAHADREAPLLESLLEVADSGITYRRRYLASLHVAPVLDLLLTDDEPALGHLPAGALLEHVVKLPHLPGARARRHRVGHRAGRRRALSRLEEVSVRRLAEVDADGRRPALVALHDELARELPALSDALTDSYLSHATQARQLARLSGATGDAAHVIYHVVHVTEYLYAEPVSTSHHDAAPVPPRDARRRSACTRSSRSSPAPAVRTRAPRPLRQPLHVLRDARAAPQPARRPRAPTSRSRRRAPLPATSAALGDRARRRARGRRRRGARRLRATPSRRRSCDSSDDGARVRRALVRRGPRPLLEAARDLTHAHPRRLRLRPAARPTCRRRSTRCCACAAASARTSRTWRSPACARWACPRAT